MIKYKNLLFFVVIASLIVQHFFTASFFGEIAKTPIVFLTPLMLIYLFTQKKILLPRISKNLIYYIIYVLAISFIYNIYFITNAGQIVFLGENIFLKTLKYAIYFSVILILVTYIYNYLEIEKNSINQLYKAVLFVSLLLLFWMIFESIFIKEHAVLFANWYHLDDIKYYRVRLLAPEESHATTMLIIFPSLLTYLSYFLNKNRWSKLFSMAIFFGGIIYYTGFSESKGFLLVLLFSTIPLLINFLLKFQIAKHLFVIVITCSLFSVFYVYESMIQIINDQLYTSITFGTRFTSIINSLKVFVLNPFGIGFGGITTTYIETLNETLNWSFVNKLNLNELRGYLATDENLSTKSFFFDNLIYGGFFFLAFFYNLFFSNAQLLLKNKNIASIFLKIPFFAVLISSVAFVTLIIKYEMWFVLVAVEFFIKREHKWKSHKQQP